MKIKSLFGKVKSKAKLLVGTMTAAMLATMTSICACAESEGTTDMSSIITSAGEQLTTEFTNLVGTLVPVLIGIAVVGLGIYGVVTLFSMAKKFFKKAAG